MMNRGDNDGSPHDFGPERAVVDDVHIMLRIVAKIHRVPGFGKMLPKLLQPHFLQPPSQVFDPVRHDRSRFPGEMFPPRCAVFPSGSCESVDFFPASPPPHKTAEIPSWWCIALVSSDRCGPEKPLFSAGIVPDPQVHLPTKRPFSPVFLTSYPFSIRHWTLIAIALLTK